MHSTCSEMFGDGVAAEATQGLPQLDRAGRLAARRYPAWTFRHLPGAASERRWRAQTRIPLTRTDIALGRCGAVYGPTLDAVTAQVRITRMVDFLNAVRRWHR